jgi:hypothetical protein
MASLIRSCLPSNSSLFFEKMDSDSSLLGKVTYWEQTKQNEIQIAIVRNPFDVAVSGAIMTIEKSRKPGSPNPEYATAMIEDEAFFIRRINIELKGLEKYYDALSKNSDDSHRIYTFEDTTNDEKRLLIIKDIMTTAGYTITPSFDSLYELADEQTDLNARENTNIIIHPQNRTEEYDIIAAKINALSDMIPFETVNQKYQAALSKAIRL